MNPGKTKSSSPRKIPDLILEKAHLAELNESEAAALNAEYGADSTYQNDLLALSASNQQILEEYSPDFVISQLEKLTAPQKTSPNYFARSIHFRVAFALVVLLIAPLGVFLIKNSPEVVRTKGMSPFINVYRKAGDSFERLGSDSKVKENDVLQVSYVAHDAKFGAVFSIDGNGKFTLHYPEKPGPAAPLIASGEVILPNAFELDNSPRFERFVFVSSKTPFNTDEITATTLAAKLPNQFTAFSILLRK